MGSPDDVEIGGYGGAGGYVEGAGYYGEDQASLLAVSTITGNTSTGGAGGSALSSGFAGGGTGGNALGGGVYNDDTLVLALVTVSGNTATGGAGGSTKPANSLGVPGNGGFAGGGGAANQSVLYVTGGLFAANSAVGGAAGLGHIAGLKGESAGGGIYNDDIAYVKDSTFTGNSAQYGGGLYNEAESTLNLTFSIVTGNSAKVAGPAVFNNSGIFIDQFNTYTALVLPIVVAAPGTQVSVAEGVSRSFLLGSFADPNGASSWTEIIDWGDSTSTTVDLPPGSLGTLAHTFASTGAHTVTVSITDSLALRREHVRRKHHRQHRANRCHHDGHAGRQIGCFPRIYPGMVHRSQPIGNELD